MKRKLLILCSLALGMTILLASLSAYASINTVYGDSYVESNTFTYGNITIGSYYDSSNINRGTHKCNYTVRSTTPTGSSNSASYSAWSLGTLSVTGEARRAFVEYYISNTMPMIAPSPATNLNVAEVTGSYNVSTNWSYYYSETNTINNQGYSMIINKSVQGVYTVCGNYDAVMYEIYT